MNNVDVIIRGVDDDLYRKLKSRAALMGLKVSEALQEAIRTWLDLEQYDAIRTENDENNLEYEKMKEKLVKEAKGKYAVFCRGKFVGLAETLTEAGALVRSVGADRALVTKIGEEEPAGGEWLWSSLELQSA